MKLTSRERKLIIVGIIAVAAIAIFYAITLLPSDRVGISQTVELKKKMLLKQRETLSREGSYRQRLQQYRKRLDQDMARLLPGDNPNVAGAELQKILADLAVRAGVEITQKNTLPEKKVPDMDTLTKVSVSIQANCDLDQLVQFLAAIENYEKFLKIEEFTITSWRQPIQKRFDIRPSLTVVGYINSQESKPTEKSASGT